MKSYKQLFKGSGRAFFLVAQVAGLILMLLGLYLAVIVPSSQAVDTAAKDPSHIQEWFANSAGGWTLVIGIALFLFALVGRWFAYEQKKTGKKRRKPSSGCH
jgi:uncharacterized membrane protein